MKTNIIVFGCLALYTGATFGISDAQLIRQLTAQKREKMYTLEQCAKKVNGFKIAGVSTLGLTAAGVMGNIALANKNKEIDNKIQYAQHELEKQQLRAQTANEKMSKAKNTPHEEQTPTECTPIDQLITAEELSQFKKDILDALTKAQEQDFIPKTESGEMCDTHILISSEQPNAQQILQKLKVACLAGQGENIIITNNSTDINTVLTDFFVNDQTFSQELTRLIQETNQKPCESPEDIWRFLINYAMPNIQAVKCTCNTDAE